MLHTNLNQGKIQQILLKIPEIYHTMWLIASTRTTVLKGGPQKSSKHVVNGVWDLFFYCKSLLQWPLSLLDTMGEFATILFDLHYLIYYYQKYYLIFIITTGICPSRIYKRTKHSKSSRFFTPVIREKPFINVVRQIIRGLSLFVLLFEDVGLFSSMLSSQLQLFEGSLR